MQQACYQPANIGHYGLALKSYTHFTSPIRRYPDLLAHRAIKHLIDGGRGEAAPLRGNELARMGSACSEKERLAEKAMRAAVKAYKLRYLSGCLGDTLDAVVSHATGKGLFVQVQEVGMKGMIPRRLLPPGEAAAAAIGREVRACAASVRVSRYRSGLPASTKSGGTSTLTCSPVDDSRIIPPPRCGLRPAFSP